MSSPDIPAILETCRQLDELRTQQEDVLLEINKMHQKLQENPEVVEKPGDGSLPRLKYLYIQAKDLSEKEVNLSNMLLGQLDTLLPSGGSEQRKKGDAMKKKKVKANHDFSRISSLHNQIELCARLEGEQVAARTTANNAAEWFVAKVLNFYKETKEFEVLDEDPGDDEDGTGQKNFLLPISCILPFPNPKNALKVPEFPPGKRVLAVYPGTTTLYKATVRSTPRKRKSNDYLLDFDDEEDQIPPRSVPFNRVIALPGHHQPRV